MNKILQIAYWMLMSSLTFSAVMMVKTGVSLKQSHTVNQFIEGKATTKQIPPHRNAQFAQAYRDAANNKSEQALERLTNVLEQKDNKLHALALYNRANISLREALILRPTDSARMALLGLAKEDYRSALLIEPALWDARYNLALSLMMSPELEVKIEAKADKSNSRSVAVKTEGFRVDLP